MPLKTGAIQGGEEIILMTRPSVWFIVLYPLKMIALIVIVTILISLVGSMLAALGIAGGMSLSIIWPIAGGFILLLITWSIFEWRCQIYVLTTSRVMTSSGVIRRRRYEASLVHLQQTLVQVSIPERCTGVGSLLFATAGTAMYDSAWLMLSDAETVQRKVQNMSRRAGRL